MRSALEGFIDARDHGSILKLMFEQDPVRVRSGFFMESELWDYKEDIPPPSANKGHESQWARIAAHSLGFHNNKGGVLIFGISDRDYRFTGTTNRLDSKAFNDKIHRYVQRKFLVSYSRESVQPNQRYLGLAVIPPRRGPVVLAAATSPLVNGDSIIEEGDVFVRVGDETRLRRGMGEFSLTKSSAFPQVTTTPRMKISLPPTARVGDPVLVTWDALGSEERGVKGIYPEPQEGTITGIGRGLVSVYFKYEDDGLYDGPLEENIAINLETGLDETYAGVVMSIEAMRLRGR